MSAVPLQNEFVAKERVLVKFGKQLPKTEELLEAVRLKAGSSDDCVYVRAIQFQFCETFGRSRVCFRHHEFPRRHSAISGALASEIGDARRKLAQKLVARGPRKTRQPDLRLDSA
jgi:hypothetical protein